MILYIGDKHLSSWSFRAWLALKSVNQPFDEVLVPLYRPETKTELLKISPSGNVPCLHHQDLKIHDSLAIAEYMNDLYPDAKLYPQDPLERALVRSICAEMHSGFSALRQELPMNMRINTKKSTSDAAKKDIQRILEIWRSARLNANRKGLYLFGDWGMADIFFAPVVSRFISYNVEVGDLKEYVASVFNHPLYQSWYQEAII